MGGHSIIRGHSSLGPVEVEDRTIQDWNVKRRLLKRAALSLELIDNTNAERFRKTDLINMLKKNVTFDKEKEFIPRNPDKTKEGLNGRKRQAKVARGRRYNARGSCS